MSKRDFKSARDLEVNKKSEYLTKPELIFLTEVFFSLFLAPAKFTLFQMSCRLSQITL